MQDKIELSTSAQQQLEEIRIRFNQAMKQQPEISDEEFMAEFEVSDEEYGVGLVLPGIGNDEKE